LTGGQGKQVRCHSFIDNSFCVARDSSVLTFTKYFLVDIWWISSISEAIYVARTLIL